MTLVPRRAEIDALLEILEPEGMSDFGPEEIEDARRASVLLLKAAYEILRKRDWWVVGHQPGPGWDATKMTVVYGIESTERAARKLAMSLGWGSYTIKKVFGSGALEADRAAQDAAAAIRFGDIPCARCGHLRVHHGAMKQSRGKPVHSNRQVRITCSAKCTCAGYQVEVP